MDINKKISEKVLSLMKQRGVTREALAKAIDVDKYKLDNYIQVKAKWDINYLVGICRVFRVSIDDIISIDYTIHESKERKQSA